MISIFIGIMHHSCYSIFHTLTQPVNATMNFGWAWRHSMQIRLTCVSVCFVSSLMDLRCAQLGAIQLEFVLIQRGDSMRSDRIHLNRIAFHLHSLWLHWRPAELATITTFHAHSVSLGLKLDRPKSGKEIGRANSITSERVSRGRWYHPTDSVPVCLFAVSSIPAAIRSGGTEPDAREGDSQLPVSQPEGVIRAQRGASFPGRLRPAPTEHSVAQDRQRECRPFHRLCRYR